MRRPKSLAMDRMYVPDRHSTVRSIWCACVGGGAVRKPRVRCGRSLAPRAVCSYLRKLAWPKRRGCDAVDHHLFLWNGLQRQLCANRQQRHVSVAHGHTPQAYRTHRLRGVAGNLVQPLALYMNGRKLRRSLLHSAHEPGVVREGHQARTYARRVVAAPIKLPPVLSPAAYLPSRAVTWCSRSHGTGA